MFGLNPQEERFALLAERVVHEVPEKTSEVLEGKILKVAQENEFNSEQIRRLSEATNQLMYNQMFKSSENAFDKTAVFPLVDPKTIIKQYYNNEDSDLKKVASLVSESMSDYYREPDTLFEKISSEEYQPEIEKQEGIDPKKEYFEKLSYARRIRDSLAQEKARLHFKIAECVDTLAGLFCYDRGPDQTLFEKQAYLLYSDSCLPILNLVRSQMDMPEIKGFRGEESLEKVGTIIIDKETQEFDLLNEAMTSLKKYASVNRKFKEFVKVLGEY